MIFTVKYLILSKFAEIIVYGTIIYVIPLTISVGSYVFTLNKTQNVNTNLQRTSMLQLQRDVLVLFRICMILFLIISLFIIHNSIGYVYWWSSQVRWLTHVISLASVTIVLPFVSPNVTKLWRDFIRSRTTSIRPFFISRNTRIFLSKVIHEGF